MTEHLKEILEAMKNQTPRRRAEIVREHARLLGIHPSTLYSKLKAAGWTSGRAPRATRGEKRLSITETQLRAVMAIQFKTHHLAAKKFLELPSFDAIYIAEQNGVIPPSVLKVATYNRWKRGLAAGHHVVSKYGETAKGEKIPRQHRNIRTDHPNHLHQVDVTNCLQWYIRRDGVVEHQSRKYAVNKNKPGVSRPKLLRYVLVDHFSGAFYVRYYIARGESTENLLDFLWRAWSVKNDPRHFPFRGVPLQLWSDKGSSLESGYMKTLARNLHVEMRSHRPGNPRAKGLVEGWMKHWEAHFETRLALGMSESLDEMNERAEKYATYYCAARLHKRHGKTRSDCWTREIGEHLRPAPAWSVFKRFCTKAVTRVVADDLTISFEGRIYRVPRHDWLGCKVAVHFAPFTEDAGAIEVRHHGEAVTIQPVGRVKGGYLADAVPAGEFRGVKKDATMRVVEEIAKVDVSNIDAHKHAAGAEYDFAPSVVQRADVAELHYDRIEAKLRVRQGVEEELGRRLAPEELETMNAEFGETVGESGINAMIRRLIGSAPERANQETKTG